MSTVRNCFVSNTITMSFEVVKKQIKYDLNMLCRSDTLLVFCVFVSSIRSILKKKEKSIELRDTEATFSF